MHGSIANVRSGAGASKKTEDTDWRRSADADTPVSESGVPKLASSVACPSVVLISTDRAFKSATFSLSSQPRGSSPPDQTRSCGRRHEAVGVPRGWLGRFVPYLTGTWFHERGRDLKKKVILRRERRKRAPRIQKKLRPLAVVTSGRTRGLGRCRPGFLERGHKGFVAPTR